MAKKEKNLESIEKGSNDQAPLTTLKKEAAELTKQNQSAETTLARKPQDPKLRSAEEGVEPFDHRAAKFILEPQPQPQDTHHEVPAYEYLGDFPSSYGTRKLYLTARDPHTLYAYWDLNHDQIVEGERSSHDGKVFLELYRKGGTRLQQVQLSPWSKEWYLNINEANSAFYAEIGYYRHDGSFEVMSRSGEALTPRDNLSPNTKVQFVTIPFEFTFAQLLDLIRGYLLQGEELATALARLQSNDFEFPFHVGQRKALPLTAQDELRDYMGGDIIRRVQAGSGEIVEILRKSWQNAQSSGQWVSSISSPFGSSFGQQKARDFFMHVNAELIIYGGTAPDAKLRINGSDIQLQPDGTFHYHFNFSDGKFHIPVEATSADGEEMRAALISFMRLSAYSNGVDKTSQPERIDPIGAV
ncbi:MAG: DUF4912 domain-containing protein [Blastochloris sp.]|nr:DUF4912 domain-containing protein [Blastochloris sp.]